ncbi:MAG: F0F1 ATP synthase subunit gamma [Alphaproteobacteria bacterium]
MPSLKDLRVRIASVRSTQKITSAMKMVAAAKLRRAQEQAEAARPYADRMTRMLVSLAGNLPEEGIRPPLLAGTGGNATHLVVLGTADRGLCGGFNASLARDARLFVRGLQAEGKTVKILCIGRKGRDALKREFGGLIIETIEDVGRRRLGFEEAEEIARRIIAMLDEGAFDVCTFIYSRFKSAMSQEVTRQQLIPLPIPDVPDAGREDGANGVYEYEPEEEEILARLLPQNLAIQFFRGLLENAASEQGARMTAMDSATRNAGDMIDRLTLNYNRTRQAYITKELIEIISGAEAL